MRAAALHGTARGEGARAAPECGPRTPRRAVRQRTQQSFAAHEPCRRAEQRAAVRERQEEQDAAAVRRIAERPHLHARVDAGDVVGERAQLRGIESRRVARRPCHATVAVQHPGRIECGRHVRAVHVRA